MRLFDFLKKDKVKYTEFALKRDEDDDSKIEIGVGIALDSSIRSSTAQANAKFSRPEYNPQTRKQFYDDGNAHKKAIDDAFANGKTVRDPYSGAELAKKQRDAKMRYGEEWQSHVAEADHIDPLSQIAKRTKNNPFLTTDDIREIGNSDDNFQVLSRKLNQGSKYVGKGGSSQQEWVDDVVRMEGLADIIESSESICEVSKRIKDTGKAAEKRNNSRALKRGVKNAVVTAHDAGKVGAQNTGVTELTISGIMNVVSVIKGEKSGEDAIADTVKDGGKAALTGYATGGGMTVVYQALSYSSSEFVQALAKNNVPGKIITAVNITGDTLKKWGEGEITTQECLIQLGDKGLNMATMGYSMAVGQALIPIPIVGGAVGALVGSMLTSNLYNNLINDLQTKQFEHEERMRIIAECNAAAEQARAFRDELESYLDSYFQEYRTCFDSALSSMRLAYEMGDADGVIAGANDITRKLGGEVKFETVSEFKSFLDSDEDDIL
ncbi:hypothetical protein [Peptostreptococcus porci]|uniref:hypothetical protein n=1 Tax=Peptostreptococcus porci TaxID=2652282 RepID=UPI002A908B45|nr:hypothetical protein [Peptostreptococcus porci]MDY6232138.1 hypothetical protein [Peptostreptococcus porci]